MSELRVLFIGCNPSLKNTNPDVPFDGTKSGVTLDKWIEKMGLTKDQCVFMNLTKYATQSQKTLKKSDVNLKQFRFEVGLQLAAAYHGTDKALSMMISAYQSKGVDHGLVANPPEQVEADMQTISETPMPKVITLGKMATWGFTALESDIPFHELPHPSGLNHKLNDRDGLEKVLADCKSWLYS